MTTQQLDERLILSTVMLHDELGLWPQGSPKKRSARFALIRSELSSPGGAESALSRISAATSSPDWVNRTHLSDEFIQSTANLLSYLSESPEDAKRLQKAEFRPALTCAVLDSITERLTSPGDRTVVPYQAIAELGSMDEVLEMMRGACDYADVSLDVVPVGRADMREKNGYLGHSVWILTPALPILMASLE